MTFKSEENLFKGWPAECRAIGQQLVASLLRDGADFYEHKYRLEERIGWPLKSGKKNKPYAILEPSGNKVWLRLRVGRNSNLMGTRGPLQQVPNAKTMDYDRDFGRVVLLPGEPIPKEVADWIDCAVRFTLDNFGHLLDLPASRDESEPRPTPEHRFDYRKAKPNRFASRVAKNRIVVKLDPDVAEVFTSSDAVNDVLRAIIRTVPQTARKARRAGRK